MTSCLYWSTTVAAANSSPAYWATLAKFEEAHKNLKYFNDLETSIKIRKGALPPIDLDGHQRLGAHRTH